MIDNTIFFLDDTSVLRLWSILLLYVTVGYYNYIIKNNVILKKQLLYMSV